MEQPFKAAFDVENIGGDRILHGLIRAILVLLDDLLNIAESGILLIGDAAHAMPILGGEGANSAILDAVEFAERIASRGLDEVEGFYERMCSEWETEVKKSEEKLASMHSDSKYSL